MSSDENIQPYDVIVLGLSTVIVESELVGG